MVVYPSTVALLTVLLSLLAINPIQAQAPVHHSPPWQFQSFFRDADLTEKTLICLDFTPDGSLWLAVSDGLYHFDGYRWSRFTTEHGLPSDYVRCVCVTSDETLWIGTDRGAGTFDGVSFDDRGTTGNLAGRSVRRIVEDSDGSLWFCCDQWPVGNISGGLTRLDDGQFTTWRRRDGLPSDYVSDYVRDSQGRQFVLTNKGLAQFSDGGFRQPLKEAGFWDVDTYVWSLVESDRHGLVAATETHFFQFKDDRWRRFANSMHLVTQPKLVAVDDGEIYTCSTGRDPMICRWTGDGFEPASRRLAGMKGDVEMLAEDPSGAIWIGGFERLLRWERLNSEWVVYGNVGAPQLKDRDGGVWFDARDGGLIRYHDGRWKEFPTASIPIIEGQDGQVWMQSAEGLAVSHDGQEISQVAVEGLSEPDLIGVGRQGVVWTFGAAADGTPAVAGYDGEQWTLTNLSQFPGHTVCYSFADPRTGIWIVLGKNRLPPFHLVHVQPGNARVVPLPERAQVSDPPKAIVLQDRTLFIYGFFGLLQGSEDGQSWQVIETPSPAVSQIIELAGEAWLACRGHVGGQAALMRYRDGVWRPFLDQHGAFAGQKNRDQELYVASHGRIQVISAGTDRFAPPYTTPFQARAESVVAGHSGEFWVGVGGRTYRYVPDQFPPETVIDGGHQQLQKGETLVLRVRGLERFKPSDSDRRFCVSMQLNDRPWTPFKPLTGEIRIPDLALGGHVLRVRVQDAERQMDTTPQSFEFRVLPIPLQSRQWFKPAVCVGFVMILGLGAVATLNWNTAHRLALGLEREVARKTSDLSSSERKYRMLFEDSQDAICLFGIDGALKSCNVAASDLLGLSVGQHVSIADIFADGNEEARFQDELHRKGHLRGARFSIRKTDGEIFDSILSCNTHTRDMNGYGGYQVIIRDISDLVKLQSRLSEIRKVEAIGRMAGGIAHDFNNFLAVVMYGAELVKLKAQENRSIKDGVQIILDAAERGKRLTSQIQTFSRAPVPNGRVIDAHKVLTGIPALLQGIVPQDVELELEVADGVGHMYGDPQQLEQVVVNLAINACHAMPEGGKLSIRALKIDVDDLETVEHQVDCPGRYLRLQVSDTGDGMDAATCERIFDPFFTTKPQGRGTGLGLAIVYGIIQQFGGRIQVHSVPHEGTCFEMYFPIRHEEVTVEAVDSAKSIPARGTETILLVEDEASIRELARRSLERFGYTVHVADDGTAAQSLIETQDHIDLVVSDVVMNGTSGFDLARWLRSNRPDVAILLISGYPHPSASASASAVLDDVDFAFLEKPFHPSVLASRIRRILDSGAAAANA